MEKPSNNALKFLAISLGLGVSACDTNSSDGQYGESGDATSARVINSGSFDSGVTEEDASIDDDTDAGSKADGLIKDTGVAIDSAMADSAFSGDIGFLGNPDSDGGDDANSSDAELPENQRPLGSLTVNPCRLNNPDGIAVFYEDEDVQVLDPAYRGEVEIGCFEICASDVPDDEMLSVDSASFQAMGSFFLPVSIDIEDMDDRINIQGVSPWQTISVLRNPLRLADGECKSVKFNADVQEDASGQIQSKYLDPRFSVESQAIASENVFYHGQEGGFYSGGTRTVFTSTDGLFVRGIFWADPDEPLSVSEPDIPATVAYHQICSHPNGIGIMDGEMRFTIAGDPPETGFLIEPVVNIEDNGRFESIDLGDENLLVARNGDEIEISVGQRILKFGECLDNEFKITEFPGIDTSMQIALSGVSTAGLFQRENPPYTRTFEDFAPIPWHTVNFVAPTILNEATFNWYYPFAPDELYNYTWDWQAVDYLYKIGTGIMIPDGVTVGDIAVRIEIENIRERFNLVFKIRAGLAREIEMDFPFSIDPGNLDAGRGRTFEFDANGLSLDLFSTLDFEIAAADGEDYPEGRFLLDPDLPVMKASLQETELNNRETGEPVNVFVNSPSETGLNDYAKRNLPGTKSILKFAEPLAELRNAFIGRRNYVIGRDVPPEGFEVFRGEFMNHYADLCLREIILFHGSGKAIPPTSQIIARIGGHTSLVLPAEHWDRNFARFTVPRNDCLEIFKEGVFDIGITFAGNIQNIDPGDVFNFSLVDMNLASRFDFLKARDLGMNPDELERVNTIVDWDDRARPIHIGDGAVRDRQGNIIQPGAAVRSYTVTFFSE